MSQIFSMFNTIFNDAPQNWQTGFQDPATPGFTGIIELHDTIFFYLIIICVGVFWVLGNVIFHFNSTNSSLVHKYLNHGTEKCLHSFFYRFSQNIKLYSLVCYYLSFFKCTVTVTLPSTKEEGSLSTDTFIYTRQSGKNKNIYYKQNKQNRNKVTSLINFNSWCNKNKSLVRNFYSNSNSNDSNSVKSIKFYANADTP